jgi:hypothetical protein
LPVIGQKIKISYHKTTYFRIADYLLNPSPIDVGIVAKRARQNKKKVGPNCATCVNYLKKQVCEKKKDFL